MIARLLIGWRGYAAAGVIGAVLGGAAFGVIQQARINGLQDSLDGARVQADVLRQANAECARDVQAAADGWAEYRRQFAEREAAARAAQADAEGRARAAEGRAEVLARRPPAPGGECAAVDELLAEYLEGRR